AQALPHGVRFVDGRYSMDVCDHDDAGYCLAHRLLPDSWRPGDDTSPDVGPFAGGPASTWMSPADVLKAYSIPASSSAKGRIVALVDEPDASAFSDVN